MDKQSRLAVARQIQLGVGPVETQRSQIKAKYLGCRSKQPSSRLAARKQPLSHSDCLGSLPRKKQGDFCHGPSLADCQKDVSQDHPRISGYS